MGSLQQQSLLKGKNIGRREANDLVHQIFMNIQTNYSNEIAIIYDGKSQSYCLIFST